MASTPRMLKAADAFHEAGYEVRMVCAEQVDWCIKAGDIERAKREWKCRIVDWHPKTGMKLYRWSRWRHYFAKKLVYWLGVSNVPLKIINLAQNRVGSELLEAVLAEPFDFVYGGTSGGVTLAYLASIISGKPFACDFEDYHLGESSFTDENSLKKNIFLKIIEFKNKKPSFITCGSSAIASVFLKENKIKCDVVNNVFLCSKNAEPIFSLEKKEIKLVWFSQRIGPNRGIEDVIGAMASVVPKPHLYLVGHSADFFKNNLINLAKKNGVLKNVTFVDAMDQNKLFDFLKQMDCGLAIEPGFDVNNKIALSNKVFSYMVSGLGLVVTKTEGQNEIIEFMDGKLIAYEPGDIKELAKSLQNWTDNHLMINEAKKKSLESAQNRWHWEHPEEKGKLLELVGRVIKSRN